MVDIGEYNPWWFGNHSEIYSKWFKSKIKWIPNIINEINLEPFSLHFLTGPRQVGKTTVLHILIENLIDTNNFIPEEIFYYPCDEIIDFRELSKIIDQYSQFKKSKKLKKSLIILDEIQFVKEWWRSIKNRVDIGEFKNTVIIISGSSRVELLKQKEQFPGRRGNGRDFELFPLSFHDFCEISIKNLSASSLTSDIEDLFISNNAYSDEEPKYFELINQNLIFKEKINALFSDYLKVGGFPRSIVDYYSKGKITSQTYSTYWSWILSDFTRLGKNILYLKEILSYLLESKVSPISWNGIAQETSINSPTTVQSYVELLELMNIIRIIGYIDDSGKYNSRKNKKIYFIDPFIVNILEKKLDLEVLDETKVEMLVGSHFSRKFNVFYWKGKTEVDIVIKVKKQLVGFEIKWGPKKWRKPVIFKNIYLLDKPIIPLFLSAFKF